IGHPKFMESLEQAYSSLEVVLGKREEVVIGILGEELASGENIFFDLSRKMLLAIANLKEKGIERMVFQRGITKE
mgnify:CR=1